MSQTQLFSWKIPKQKILALIFYLFLACWKHNTEQKGADIPEESGRYVHYCFGIIHLLQHQIEYNAHEEIILHSAENLVPSHNWVKKASRTYRMSQGPLQQQEVIQIYHPVSRHDYILQRGWIKSTHTILMLWCAIFWVVCLVILMPFSICLNVFAKKILFQVYFTLCMHVQPDACPFSLHIVI